ncbi:MAG: DUF362 domain-containing protein, partial [Desulfobulbaceae bacterium]|nr:DUF362 domain-containing protein [Desulfobulbaceae bacterium]
MNRREFIIVTAGGIISVVAGSGNMAALAALTAKPGESGRARVALIKTSDRASGIKRAIELLGVNPVEGKEVLLKPNFNTADPFPASTHNDTLIALSNKLKELGASRITIGERCGPPDTDAVLRDKGIGKLCKKHGLGLINFEELPDE